MIEAPIALAFAAGMVATVNPCGFAMLPAYLSYFMGLDGDAPRSRAAAVGSAFGVGAIVSLGFLVVFGLAGLLITAGFRTVIDWIPWLALLIGVGVIGLGIALLRGFDLNVSLFKAQRGRKGRDFRSVFMFGVSYAVASLSCTLPVFLTVVAGQVTQTNLISGLLTFIVYGMGMALVLLALTVALALGKASLVSRFRSAMKHVNTISGVILIVAGVYIVWFWGTSLISGATGLDSAGFRFVENLSQTALNFVGDNTGIVAIVMAALLAAAGLVAVRDHRRTHRLDIEDRQKIDSLT
ncbi:MAG: cytochrome c biogenesis CcdA family protein [Acidimicrobiia bacterium]|nr:cytochrome c biogenesis CcdA family protein [Acidimicrobiia bacterium]MDX2467655.1 cytochrome c biogenesis CcdA family protein [Acidimicrobiia bacterium]